MLTLVLQQLAPIVLALFGLVALRNSPQASRTEARSAGWHLVGGAFFLIGLQATVQGAFAVWAYLSGEGTTPYDLYVLSQPFGNAGRGCLVIGFSGLLLISMIRGNAGAVARSRHYWTWLISCFLLGLLFVLSEDRLSAIRHWEDVTMLEAMELMFLLPALWFAVSRDAMDHLLWLALATYAFREALTVSLTSGMVFTWAAGAWAPSPWLMQTWFLATNLAMLGFAMRRRRFALRGLAVPALFELDGSVDRANVASQLGR